MREKRPFNEACDVLNKISKANQGKRFTGEQIRQFLGQAGVMKHNSMIPMLIKLGFIEKFGVTRWTSYEFTRKEFHPKHFRIIYDAYYKMKRNRSEKSVQKEIEKIPYWTSTTTW